MCIPVPTAPAILSVEYMSVDWMDDSPSGPFQISFGASHTKVQSIKASHINTFFSGSSLRSGRTCLWCGTKIWETRRHLRMQNASPEIGGYSNTADRDAQRPLLQRRCLFPSRRLWSAVVGGRPALRLNGGIAMTVQEFPAGCGVCGPDRRVGGSTLHLTHPNPPCCSPRLWVEQWEAIQHAERYRTGVAAHRPTMPPAQAHPLRARQPVAHAQFLLSRSVSPCRARGYAPADPAPLPCAERSISGFPLLLPRPPPRSFSFAGSGVIPDQDGGRGASQLLRLLSAGISFDLHGRPLGQRANVGQRRRCSRRRRGRAEPLVTTPSLPRSPQALPALRTPWDPVPAGARRRAQATGFSAAPAQARRSHVHPSRAAAPVPGPRPQRAPCSPLGPASSARSPPARAPSSPRGRTYCCWVSVPCLAPPRLASTPAGVRVRLPARPLALCGLRALTPPRLLTCRWQLGEKGNRDPCPRTCRDPPSPEPFLLRWMWGGPDSLPWQGQNSIAHLRDSSGLGFT